MTGKRLTIALALAIPLLVVGAGLAMASADVPDSAAGNQIAAPATLAAVQVSTATAVPATCGNCTGPCNGGESCRGDCNGNCGQIGGTCGGQCAGLGAGRGACVGSGNCAGGTGTAGRGCGMRWGAKADTNTACPSCDVVGLNEYPTYSPKYAANV